jgi:hypothetical protein
MQEIKRLQHAGMRLSQNHGAGRRQPAFLTLSGKSLF